MSTTLQRANLARSENCQSSRNAAQQLIRDWMFDHILRTKSVIVDDNLVLPLQVGANSTNVRFVPNLARLAPNVGEFDRPLHNTCSHIGSWSILYTMCPATLGVVERFYPNPSAGDPSPVTK